MKTIVTGGGGFVGSHVAEYYATNGHDVTVLDNLSRTETLDTTNASDDQRLYNWRHLGSLDGVERVEGDVRDTELVDELASDADAIVHTAGQVAVTTSLEKPRLDFEVNAEGTLNVLEAARRAMSDPSVVVASTNKVYGENVNEIPVREEEGRYAFDDDEFGQGIPETLPLDGCKHTPYGVSKLAADLYTQDYARTYGLQTGVFRMSCIYGTRQFGTEDQGWVAHFILAALRDEPITIYGDGKQVRDVLWIDDLVRAYDAFIQNGPDHGVWNVGGGPDNTVSLLELLDRIEAVTGERPETSFGDWREGDQKVYISDTRKARRDLGWTPKVGPREGVKRFVEWARTIEA